MTAKLFCGSFRPGECPWGKTRPDGSERKTVAGPAAACSGAGPGRNAASMTGSQIVDTQTFSAESPSAALGKIQIKGFALPLFRSREVTIKAPASGDLLHLTEREAPDPASGFLGSGEHHCR